MRTVGAGELDAGRGREEAGPVLPSRHARVLKERLVREDSNVIYFLPTCKDAQILSCEEV